MDKTTFNLVFGLAMCGFPAALATFIKTQPGADQERISRLSRLLWVATAISAAIVVALAPITHMTWMLSFLLWFGLANKIFIAKNPGLAHPPGTVRSASLKPRDIQGPIPKAAWVALVLYVMGGGIAIAYHAHSNVLPWGIWSGALLWLGLTPWCCKAMLNEPEPLDSQGSPELEAAYRDSRNFRAWGFFAAGVAAVTLFQLAALMIALGLTHQAAWVGGIGGTLVGIGGGVFGTMADLRRAKVANLRRDCEQS